MSTLEQVGQALAGIPSLSVAHSLGGATIWFGLEEVAGDKRLVSASRTFTPGAIVK